MSFVDLKAEVTSAMSDPEFSREIRYFTGKLKLAIDAVEAVFEFNDGKLVKASDDKVADADCKIYVKGNKLQWTNMLAKYPVPFFQCFQTTNIKHGLVMSTTNETYAYLPALNRLLAFMRKNANQE